MATQEIITSVILVKDNLEDPIITQNAETVLKRRYYKKDEEGNIVENAKDMYVRVAEHIASCEIKGEYWAKEFYKIMARNEFMPNSPCLMNAGKGTGMLSACFVLPVEDDMSEIMNTAKHIALIQKAGGGTGMSFSRLRPNGSIVKSSGGTTTGPMAFLETYSKVTDAIQQGSFRRGANMGIMHITHPDIVTFINFKEDLTKLQNYNISVAIPDEWMKLLETAPDTPHKVNHDKWGEGQISVYWTRHNNPGDSFVHHEKIYDEVKAFKNQENSPPGWAVWTIKDTWDLICKRAHATGEPGLFFIDKANKDNVIKHLGDYEATNPCVTGDTKILTINGPVAIKDLSSEKCSKCRGEGYFESYHNGDTWDCSTCNGTGQADGLIHKVFAWDPESKLPVIRPMRHIRKTGHNKEILEVEFDSGLKVKCTPNHNFRSFRGEKIEAQDLKIGQSVRAFSISKHRDGHLRAHGWVAGKTAHQWVHRMIWEEANGEIPEDSIIHHIDENPVNNSIDNLELLSLYRHQSIHYVDRLKSGFHNKNADPEIIDNLISEKNHKVIGITKAGKEDVYNGTVDDVHTYIIIDPEYKGDGPDGVWSGIVSCNCGEQPLFPYDSCNLGSINLSKFYNEDEETRFDWVSFKDTIHTSVRFLDNCITVNKYPIPEIAEMAHKIRRIGLGVMGWADLLYQLGIPYNSGEACELAESISLFLRNEADMASRELAKEKGHFPEFQNSSLEHPQRNAFTTTIAPTGTISIIAGCSGGIEPMYALAFDRTVMKGDDGEFVQMKEINPHFEKALETEFGPVIENDIIDHIKKNGSFKGYQYGQDRFDVANSDLGRKLDKFIKIFITAHDIEPEAHLRMQAAWQTHIDSAISKTINMPRESTIEEVQNIYKRAFELNCKGVTVYRDGCRDKVEGMKQPMSVNKETQDIEPLMPEKVEKKLEEKKAFSKKETEFKSAIKFEFRSQFGTMHVKVVLSSENKPIEIFAQIGKSADMVAADLEAICRLTSLLLQEGVALQTITAQLYAIGSSQMTFGPNGKIHSLPDALAKALIYWLENNSDSDLVTKKSSLKSTSERFDSNYGIPCPSCSSGKLAFEEGCKKCHSCGYSAC